MLQVQVHKGTLPLQPSASAGGQIYFRSVEYHRVFDLIPSSDFILQDEVEGGYEPPAAAGLPLRCLGLLCHHLHTVVLPLWSRQQLGTGSSDQGALS